MVIFTHATPTQTDIEKIPKWTLEVKFANLDVKLVILVGKWRYFRLNPRKNLHFYSFWPILDETYAINHKNIEISKRDQFCTNIVDLDVKLVILQQNRRYFWHKPTLQFWRFYSSESLKFRVWKWLRVIKSSPLSKALIKTSDTLETTRSQDLCIR